MAPMSDTIKPTPKPRKIRPVHINTGVAHVALGNIEKLTESQIEGVLTNLGHQLLHDFVNPEIIDWIVSQDVVVHTRRLWQCAAREAEDIDQPVLWLKWLGQAEWGFWKALSVLNQLKKRNQKRVEADLAAQVERPDA